MALAAYRHLLRATGIAFQGDIRVLTAARQEARKRFEQQANLPSDSPAAGAAIAHAEEVTRILRHNIVQGQPYMPTAASKAGQPPQFYKLRIHKDIERGDNPSVKQDILARAQESGENSCWSKET